MIRLTFTNSFTIIRHKIKVTGVQIEELQFILKEYRGI